MRINLKVPFAEKDEAKKLGARWDAARKLWYVAQQADMTPFMRWSPVPHESGHLAEIKPKPLVAVAQKSTGKVYVGDHFTEVTRVCACLPWDVCDLCRATALP